MGEIVLSQYHSLQLPRWVRTDGSGGFRVLWAVEICGEADVEPEGAEEDGGAVQSPAESCADASSDRPIDTIFPLFTFRFPPSPPPLGSATPLFIAGSNSDNNSSRYIRPFPRHLRAENTPEVGQKHPVARKFMLRATQNMLKCKTIVKKWLFDGFGHVG